ncbi:hypothetical protein [Streptomyces iconiensis]|uniref:DUF5666 domain-containing protein n=1 Tax=Streptomyces iconiensis TaxID=1384038 RepID=A0ABT6ZWJ1_9ACTN|nr:hypothetical protein [Streptomyces iconiensis]MDJ1132763.1 hypothetical protein [Streptomyces iconiensis]
MSVLALSAAATPATATPGATRGGGGEPPVPQVRAYDGNRPVKDPRSLTKLCADAEGKRASSRCRFILDKEPTEYTTALTSVGNTVENCTDDPIKVEREVELTSSSTDNIGGEISGSATIEGTVDNTAEMTFDDTAEVSGSATKENATESTNQTWSPHSAKANSSSTSKASSKASATAAGKNTAHVGAKDSVHVGMKASFTAAFKATFSKSWTQTVKETTTHTFTVRSGKVLSFGVEQAMSRVKGTLQVDKDKQVQGIAVDTPSTVNSSNVVAQTFPSQKCKDKGQQSGQTNPEEGDEDNSGGARWMNRARPAAGDSSQLTGPGDDRPTTRPMPNHRPVRGDLAVDGSLIPGQRPENTDRTPLARG